MILSRACLYPEQTLQPGLLSAERGACLVPKATAAHRGIPQCSSLELEVTSAYLNKELPAWPRALGGVIVYAHGVLHGQLCVTLTDACQGGQFVTQQALPPILVQTLCNQTHPSTSLL